MLYPTAGNWEKLPWFQWTTPPANAQDWAIVLFLSSAGSLIEFQNGDFVLSQLISQAPRDIILEAGQPPEPLYRAVGVQVSVLGIETLGFTRLKTWWDAATLPDWLEIPRVPSLFRAVAQPRWIAQVDSVVSRDSRVHEERLPLDWRPRVYAYLQENAPPDILHLIEGGGRLESARRIRRVIRALFPRGVDPE